MYVRGGGGGKFQFLEKKHLWVLFIRFVLYKGFLQKYPQILPKPQLYPTTTIRDGRLNENIAKLSVHTCTKANAFFVLAMPSNLYLFVLLKNEINQYDIMYDTTTVLQQCLPEPIFSKRKFS